MANKVDLMITNVFVGIFQFENGFGILYILTIYSHDDNVAGYTGYPRISMNL